MLNGQRNGCANHTQSAEQVESSAGGAPAGSGTVDRRNHCRPQIDRGCLFGVGLYRV